MLKIVDWKRLFLLIRGKVKGYIQRRFGTYTQSYRTEFLTKEIDTAIVAMISTAVL